LCCKCDTYYQGRDIQVDLKEGKHPPQREDNRKRAKIFLIEKRISSLKIAGQF
jgi:hypothetical protein